MKRDRDQTAKINPIWRSSREDSWMHLDVAIFIGPRHQQPGEEVHDWGAIEGHDHSVIVARSRHNCGPIATRSWPHRDAIAARLPRYHGPIDVQIMTTITGSWCSWSSCDRDHRSASNRVSNTPNFSDENPFQNGCTPYFSTLDWFVKQLSKFRAKSWLLPDPPTFRLDCEAIGVGLIVNFNLISSNFPLERQTSARKKLCKFASIRVNWSPILATIRLVVRFDWLSGGNLSFNEVYIFHFKF